MNTVTAPAATAQIQTSRALTPLIERAKDFAACKTDYLLDTHKFYFDGPNLIIADPVGNIALEPEDLALSQLAGRLGSTFWDQAKRTIPVDTYRQLHRHWPSHFASLTNAMLDEVSGKFLIRGYDSQARAILSEEYAKVDNLEILEGAAEVLADQSYVVVESGKYYSRNDGIQRDEMTVRVVVKNVKPQDDSPYGLGVMIRNGETGGSAFEILPLVMRHSCFNSLVLRRAEDGTTAGFRTTHRGNKASKLNLGMSAVVEALNIAADGLDRFLAMKDQQIDLAAVIAKLGTDRGWSEEMGLLVGIGAEGHQSVYGLMNGITFAAHELDIDTTSRFNLESYATELMYKPEALVAIKS